RVNGRIERRPFVLQCRVVHKGRLHKLTEDLSIRRVRVIERRRAERDGGERDRERCQLCTPGGRCGHRIKRVRRSSLKAAGAVERDAASRSRSDLSSQTFAEISNGASTISTFESSRA